MIRQLRRSRFRRSPPSRTRTATATIPGLGRDRGRGRGGDRREVACVSPCGGASTSAVALEGHQATSAWRRSCDDAVRRRVRFDPGCALVEHWARRAQGEGRFCAVARLDEHDTGLSSARCPALPVGLRADRLEQLEDGIEDVFHTPLRGRARPLLRWRGARGCCARPKATGRPVTFCVRLSRQGVRVRVYGLGQQPSGPGAALTARALANTPWRC